ncbi:hypothetical protein COLO4_09805 [Corchorus olitorius]|uniref:Uncharacterized protein n=1 Tax=Corchorus olitorius TaxID=93759 RepID=A0A1R3KB08_9ROSI|nr:hypothetical protein COLO4_09805 [Corchorus olitorius]
MVIAMLGADSFKKFFRGIIIGYSKERMTAPVVKPDKYLPREAAF